MPWPHLLQRGSGVAALHGGSMQSGQTQHVTRAAGCQKWNSVSGNRREKTLTLDFLVPSCWTYSNIMLSWCNKLLLLGRNQIFGAWAAETSAAAEMAVISSFLFSFLRGHDRFLWHVLASESTRQNNNFERKAHPQNSKRKNSSEWPITLPILFSGKNPWPWIMKLFPENSSIADWCRYAPKDRESLCALCSKPSQGQVLVKLLFRCKLW